MDTTPKDSLLSILTENSAWSSSALAASITEWSIKYPNYHSMILTPKEEALAKRVLQKLRTERLKQNNKTIC